MFNIPRYLASHPKRWAKKIKEWAKQVEDRQRMQDRLKNPQSFVQWVHFPSEHPNCRCSVVIPKIKRLTYETGDFVTVYDRYRFAIPLQAVVKMRSSSNDGIEVVLENSNNPNYPTGSAIWVHAHQLERREVKQ
jgi:hypothetical protein